MPETTPYLVFGLAVTGGLLALYATILILRFRGAHKDLAVLDQIERE